MRRDRATGNRRAPADSYAGVLRQSLGPTLYAAMYGPYARKLWGLDGERIDAEQARKRVSADTPLKIAARILRRLRNRPEYHCVLPPGDRRRRAA